MGGDHSCLRCIHGLRRCAAAPQPGFSLTIYSNADPATFDPQEIVRQQTFNPYYPQQNPLPGYGIVRENREIKLDEGDNTIRFTDVATGIDPTTVSFQSLTAPDAATRPGAELRI